MCHPEVRRSIIFSADRGPELGKIETIDLCTTVELCADFWQKQLQTECLKTENVILTLLAFGVRFVFIINLSGLKIERKAGEAKNMTVPLNPGAL
jgi:hypothetical protein